MRIKYDLNVNWMDRTCYADAEEKEEAVDKGKQLCLWYECVCVCMRKLKVTNQSIAFFVEKGIYPSDIGLIVPFIWQKTQNKTEMCAHFFAHEKNSIVKERTMQVYSKSHK